uniref:PH domain-containing protein n=1 Tax=Plectus sambesii TaxID=2011161 RepID=A0A914UN80_9BILA
MRHRDDDMWIKAIERSLRSVYSVSESSLIVQRRQNYLQECSDCRTGMHVALTSRVSRSLIYAPAMTRPAGRRQRNGSSSSPQRDRYELRKRPHRSSAVDKGSPRHPPTSDCRLATRDCHLATVVRPAARLLLRLAGVVEDIAPQRLDDYSLAPSLDRFAQSTAALPLSSNHGPYPQTMNYSIQSSSRLAMAEWAKRHSVLFAYHMTQGRVVANRANYRRSLRVRATPRTAESRQ